MKATREMIEAIKNVHPKERKAAALIAEKTFFIHLEQNRSDHELAQDDASCVEMAGMAAAAEVAFLYA